MTDMPMTKRKASSRKPHGLVRASRKASVDFMDNRVAKIWWMILEASEHTFICSKN